MPQEMTVKPSKLICVKCTKIRSYVTERGLHRKIWLNLLEQHMALLTWFDMSHYFCLWWSIQILMCWKYCHSRVNLRQVGDMVWRWKDQWPNEQSFLFQDLLNLFCVSADLSCMIARNSLFFQLMSPLPPIPKIFI